MNDETVEARDEPGVLSGVRILEITAEPGQYAGKLFADLGADVIKVEPLRGDPVRSQIPFIADIPGADRSLLWWQLDSGKRSLALDLLSSDGRALLRRLLATVQIVLCSGPLEDLERIGAPFDAARRARPMVVTTITPYGWTGPKRRLPATDLTAQAAGGISQITGLLDEPPMWIAGAVTQYHTSLHAAAGTLMALWDARRDGSSQHVDVSMQESIAAAVQPDIMFWDLCREVRGRLGPNAVRTGTGLFEARDGWVMVHAMPRRLDQLVAWLDSYGMAGDLGDPRWADVQQWLAEREHVNDIIAAFCGTQDVETLADEGQMHRALVFPALDALQVSSDPQVKARDWLVQVSQRACKEPVRHPGAPFRLSRRPWRMRCGAPLLGEHTMEILAEVGVDSGALTALAAAGVIA